MALNEKRQLMWHQGRSIETFLRNHHGIAAALAGGDMLPRFIRYRFQSHVRLSQVSNLSTDLARFLDMGEEMIRVAQSGSYITIEVPRKDMSSVKLSNMIDRICQNTDCLPKSAAVLGMDTEGAAVMLRLTSADIVHVLVSGMTGSGKTVLARSMIASLAYLNRECDWGLVLIDPNGRGYRPFNGLPHLVGKLPVVTDAADAVAALRWLVTVMEKRDRDGQSTPRIAVFIDELADLIMQDAEVETLLTRLTQRGRHAGIHIVACTQKPTAEVIGTLAKANFPTRIVGKVASPEDAKVASGRAQTGAERLLGRGDFLLIYGSYSERFQAATVGAKEIGEIVTECRAGQPANSAEWERGLPDNVIPFRQPAVSQNGHESSDNEQAEVARLVATGEISHAEGERRLFGSSGGRNYYRLEEIIAETSTTTEEKSYFLARARK